MLPELVDESSREPNALNKEYSSGDSVLDHEGTVELLNRHGLLSALEGSESSEEMLR
jgi:hypothetical protein